MSGPFRLTSTHTSALVLSTTLLLTGVLGARAGEELLGTSPEKGGIGLALQQKPDWRSLKKLPTDEWQPSRSDLNTLDERLSIFVTDKATTSAIKFSDVMDRLAKDMGVDKLDLFRQWWDTANIAPGLRNDRDNIFCNSESKQENGFSQKNGFPYRCPRESHSGRGDGEGLQATLDPFSGENDSTHPEWINAYTAIAFSNRFDLANRQGEDCGEFRIVFARNKGFEDVDGRNLINFEARVPNPDDQLRNLDGCRWIVEFWRHLSDPKMCTAIEPCTVTRGTLSRSFS